MSLEKTYRAGCEAKNKVVLEVNGGIDITFDEGTVEKVWDKFISNKLLTCNEYKFLITNLDYFTTVYFGDVGAGSSSENIDNQKECLRDEINSSFYEMWFSFLARYSLFLKEINNAIESADANKSKKNIPIISLAEENEEVHISQNAVTENDNITNKYLEIFQSTVENFNELTEQLSSLLIEQSKLYKKYLTNPAAYILKELNDEERKAISNLEDVGEYNLLYMKDILSKLPTILNMELKEAQEFLLEIKISVAKAQINYESFKVKCDKYNELQDKIKDLEDSKKYNQGPQL
ncbi:MAG: hypothetical protein J0H68_00605 [Sphingobacteriia bacterium]|nr:hypothetical protein [Sphingobacteriia bacterium]